jgi:OOP family OmpA-OmpF porin
MKKTAVALLCSALPFAANANDSFYFDAGYTSMEVDLGVDTTNLGNGITLNVDDSDSAGTFLVGYKVNDNFAVEGGFITGADASVSITNANATNGNLYGSTLVLNANSTISVNAEGKETYFVGGKFNFPMSKEFSLDARAGMMWWDIDYSVSANAAGTYGGAAFAINENFFVANADGSDAYYGLGATYNVNDSFAIKADYTMTEMDDSDVDAYTISASMKF